MNKFFPAEMKRKILSLIFILGLVYLILPGPTKIEDFPPLTPSLKSTLEGDTIQNPNIAAYFSDFRRDYITDYYKQKFASLHIFGRILPPLTLNHPPEYAYQYIRDQQESTFLEEYVYPLRESFFVNGYEPEVENRIYNRGSDFTGNHIIVRNNGVGEELFFNSKATVRFYPTNILGRVLVYTGIWLAAVLIYKLFLKALKD
ncbi:MAG: hypothetical protein UU73_C0001G0111 [Candidatus Daviesbacteria bacterium GW2011_GWA1_41_61]|uniref:Uncharacterized protein n=1 Tax=Candidatus Daviesbacteria bacterium GW2011_GWA2_40_9 TaxID=1618424 RepID=A0A0G0U1L8_9BACT|nr:MAG: hypothetical protein UU26_C0001G0054 [Candidatus Daviesbacteria bacterium GW2011_GWC1_40_9]KKR83004.1 MAG: hypothetical protein UU29_C0008G0113 [Candidatus Daviesbacteria bacterium GW2011_GWA2_40_9]KKR92930.1 MAG: hypothetical protein UU44_C0004G0112 [Candidatus Daviesbacteria bacterium GW2011_GWB1_41_15]KKS15474.1 MAG: hypothetical protein UU73_C0001G0111 [Candidatus Daviesbacteria bacterium GW2011_GWA1_41_61]